MTPSGRNWQDRGDPNMHFPRLPKTHLVVAFAAAITIGSALALPAAAHGLFDRPKGNLEVSGNETLDLAGLGPGSAPITNVIGLHASGSLTYRVRSEWSGSAVLARTLELTLTDSTGHLIYRGPFGGARVGGSGWDTALDLRLTDGQAESIAMTVSLPLSAGNEIQGAELSARLVVEATESLD
jgi:hypothetical protein